VHNDNKWAFLTSYILQWDMTSASGLNLQKARNDVVIVVYVRDLSACGGCVRCGDGSGNAINRSALLARSFFFVIPLLTRNAEPLSSRWKHMDYKWRGDSSLKAWRAAFVTVSEKWHELSNMHSGIPHSIKAVGRLSSARGRIGCEWKEKEK